MGQDPMRGSSPKGAGQARRARRGGQSAPSGGLDLQGSAATASRVPSVARRDGSPLEENRKNTKLLIYIVF
ncbi:hypothetical protein B7M50_23615, partial [Salmonella enterica]|nr:hypothetical protein [Salmonella enterica]